MQSRIIREKLTEMVRQSPFRPFVLKLENGDRVVIEHPENIAFNPTAENGRWPVDLFVRTHQHCLITTFAAVTSIGFVESPATG